MKQKQTNCICCTKEITVPIVNQPWCEECIEKERKRSIKEDYLGRYRYSRPPRYVLDKSQWNSFGYEDK